MNKPCGKVEQADPKLLEFCQSESEIAVIEAWIKRGSQRGAAEELKKSRSTIRNVIKIIKVRAASAGYAPEQNLDYPIAQGMAIKGTSDYIDGDGNLLRRWVKTDKNKEQLEEDIKETVAALKETIKPVKRIKAPKKNKSKLLNLYTLTDFHLGMLAWHEETGADWDLDIAENMMVSAFKHLIEHSPEAEVGFFNELGDFEHYDSHVAITPMNNHILDSDGRPTKMIRTSIRVQRQVIEMMAQKYPKVVVLNAEGNHNIISSVWKRELFAEFYRDNPRIDVITEVLPYYAYEWGVNMLGFHHGHLKKGSSSADVFLSNHREMYGRTKCLHIHGGHQHHREIKESSTHIWEMHPTLAAADAYAARGGWGAQRAMQQITYHQDFFETSRCIFRPEMLLSC